MVFLKFFFGSIGSVIDRILCVVFAVVLAQAPVYIAQYIDVLAGAQMEAQKTYDDLDNRAAKYEMTVKEFLDRLLENSDPLVRENAEATASTVDRYVRYSAALDDLLNSSALSRPFKLMKHYDPSIHAAMKFEPNVPLTIEGAFYALAGVLIALLIIGFFRMIFNKIFTSSESENAKKSKTEAEG